MGIVRKHLGYLLQHLLHLVSLLDHQLFHLCDLPLLLLHHRVHIQAISFIRRNPARRRMGLENQTHLFQVRHLIADGRRT